MNGPMLKLVNRNAGTDDTALRLEVDPTEPPMRFNSPTKVNRFNADQLDGKDAFQFVANSTYTIGSGLERAGTPQSGGKVLSQSCLPGDRMLSGARPA